MLPFELEDCQVYELILTNPNNNGGEVMTQDFSIANLKGQMP